MKIKFDIKLELINTLIHYRRYQHYLEIGVDKGNCFNQVKVARKYGVDPVYHDSVEARSGEWYFNMKSDEYFAELDKYHAYKSMFNIVLIDGMHLCDFALSDFINASKYLMSNGCILLHDCNPPNERQGSRKRIDAVWNGDVWKVLWFLDKHFPELKIRMFDTDQGITLVENIHIAKETKIHVDHINEMIELPFSELGKIRDKYLVEPEIEVK